MESSFHITEYLSEGCPKVQCVIKKFYSDFSVQEISKEGEVVPFRSLEEADRLFEEYKQHQEGLATSSQASDVPTPSAVTEDVQLLLNGLLDKSVEDTVVVDCTGLDKEKRKEVHIYVRKAYAGLLESSTLDDNIVVSRKTNVRENRKRSCWPDSVPDYLHFTMAKEFKDGHYALETLAKFLHVNISRFGTAGTKDRRAVTTQRVSAYRVEADKLHRLNKTLRGIRVYDFSYEKEALKLGALQGNRFTIVLRDLTILGETKENKSLQDLIVGRIEHWKEHGFINYFGTQRFGSCGIPTSEVGKLILASRYKDAVDLLLSKSGGSDGGRSIEHGVAQQIKKSPADFKGAIMKIPRPTRSMYVHAYQSAVFNQVVSRRVKAHGTKVCDGDVSDEGGLPLTSFGIQMPLPSHDVSYPSSVEEWYREILKDDGISEEDFAAHAKEFAIGAAYRPPFVKPKDVEYYFKEGYADNEHLLPDLENYPKCCPLNEPERTSSSVPSERLALIVSFTLPPGAYATMALRELVHVDLGKEAMKSAEAL